MPAMTGRDDCQGLRRRARLPRREAIDMGGMLASGRFSQKELSYALDMPTGRYAISSSDGDVQFRQLQ